MKFAATALAFASIFAAANAKHKKSESKDEVTGELSISLGSEPCKLTCKWGANLDERRRLLRGADEEIPFSIVEFEMEHEHRKLFVALANVVCTLDLGEKEIVVETVKGEEVETEVPITYSKEIPFPDGWTTVAKKADGGSTFRGFATGFTVEDGLGVPLAEGELEVEFTKGKITDDKGNDESIVVFDGHAIGVSCV